MQPLVIPARLETPDGPLSVTRAWFQRVDAGQRQLSFEGRDQSGSLRAGLMAFDDAARLTRVRVADDGRDPKLPALERLLRDGELLVHRPGRRAVVRTADGYAKALRPGKLADAAERARAFHALGGSVFAPEVLRTAADGELTVAVVPGESLHQLGAKSDDRAWSFGWRAWARAWPEWVRTPHPAGDLPRHGVDDEERVLAGWLLRVETAQPAGLDISSLRERFGAVMAALQGLGRDVWRLSHRDLHDKQVLVDSGVGLIDSDTLALADPALDLGNLLAHVRLREVQGLLDTARAAAAAELIHAVADELEVPAKTLDAWGDAARLRLSCVYAFRPPGSAS